MVMARLPFVKLGGLIDTLYVSGQSGGRMAMNGARKTAGKGWKGERERSVRYSPPFWT
jgi:hypothetical protein